MLDKSGAQYLFTNPNKQNFILDREVLQFGFLKVINTCSTGLNHIDIDYCKENNIDVWSLKEDYELINDLPSTSELAFGLMMSLMRNIPKSFHSLVNTLEGEIKFEDEKLLLEILSNVLENKLNYSE